MTQSGLRNLSATSWVTIETVYRQAFGAAVFAVQAPLLGPRAFGLITIVMIFVMLCETLLDTVTEVLISLPRIEHAHYSTMVGITLWLGLAIAVLLMLAGSPIATWFGEPQLAAVVRTMAIFPLLTVLACPPVAATKRDMQFKPLAMRTIAGLTCGGLVGITLAVLHAGVWALVFQNLVQRIVCLIVLWSNTNLQWGLKLSRPHWRQISAFIWPLLVMRLMTWASGQLPRFILALNFTVAELGLYALASRLSDILVQVTVAPRAAVARVALRQFKAGSAELNAAVTTLIQGMSALMFPACILGAVLVPTLIHAWLNPNWFGAIKLTQFLLVTSGTAVTFFGGGSVFLAQNRQHNEAVMSVIQTVTLALAAYYFGAYGLTIFAMAMALRPLPLIPLEAVLVRRACHVPIAATLGVQIRPLIAAAMSGLGVWFIRDAVVSRLGNGQALVVLSIAGISLYVLAAKLVAPQALLQIRPRLRLS